MTTHLDKEMMTTYLNEPSERDLYAERVATHEATGIEAPASLWRALGATLNAYRGALKVTLLPQDASELLWLGKQESGELNAKAILWALKERQRRKEAKTHATAIARLGDAILALADAVAGQRRP